MTASPSSKAWYPTTSGRSVPDHAVWAALLTAQGKWLADFFVLAGADALLLDCEARTDPDADPAPVALPAAHEGHLARGARSFTCTSPGAAGRMSAGIIAPDPRLPDFAWRMLSLNHSSPTQRQRTGTGIGWPPGCRTGRRTWRRIAACCWRPGSMSWPACRGRRAATWARN